MTFHVVCLNPAVDVTFFIDGFTAGNVYPGQRETLRPGGKGVNCARVLSQLGEKVHLLLPLGMGGECILEDMESRCRCTVLQTRGACRRTYNIMDRLSGRETVISQTGPQAESTVLPQLLDHIDNGMEAGDVLVLSGSVMEGLPENVYAILARECERKHLRCALDCNATLLPANLGASYFFVKPNETELCAAMNVPDTEEPERLLMLARRMPSRYCLVSMGARGGLLVSQEEAYVTELPAYKVRSTVGSGDAAFAGALSAICRGKNMEEALRLSMACGIDNALKGMGGSVDLEQVEKLVSEIQINRMGGRA